MFTTKSDSKLDIFGHYHYMFCMNGTQVSIFKQSDKVHFVPFSNTEMAIL